MVTESQTGGTDTMAMGLKLGTENIVTKSLDNIVGNLWQARQESSGSSLGNQSPRNEDMSDPEHETSSPRRESSPDESHLSTAGTVRLKDPRDLIKDDGGGGDKDSRAAAAFLAGLPNFPGFEAFTRHQRDFLSNPQSLLQAASTAVRTPPSSNNSFVPYSPGNNNNNGREGRANSPSAGGASSPSSRSGREDSYGNSQQNWSFEEQFKQLYEIDDNPKRKDFLDELFTMMQKRGTPINRLPIMAKQVLDLFELYNLVCARGGLVEVINKKLWQEVIKGLGLPSSITSAAFTLRTQYTKYLYPLECIKRNLSSPNELQVAIEGNKREGRRSSYGAYSDAVGHMAGLSGLHPQQISAMSLVNQRNQQHPNGFPTSLSPPSPFPPGGPQDPMSALEMTRLALWKMYNQSSSDARGNGLPLPRLEEPEESEKRKRPSEERINGHSNKRVSEDREMSSPKRTNNRDPSPLQNPPEAVRMDGLEEEEEEAEIPREDSEKRLNDDTEDEEVDVEAKDSPKKVQNLSGLPGANIKISSRGDGHSKDSSLVVSMEINGISYQGVLFAQPASKATTEPSSS